MKNFILYFFLFTLLSFNLYAHDVGQWCSNGQSKNISQVILTQQELVRNLSQGVSCLVEPADPALLPPGSDQKEILEYIAPVIFKQHGQLDHPNVPGLTDDEVEDIRYRTALAYAYCSCSTMAGLSEIDPDVINPDIKTPEATDPEHHGLFDFSHGFKFTCQLCEHDHD